MKIADNIIVPTYRLRIVVPDLGKVYAQYKERVMTKDQIAKSMKVKPTNGNFNQKMSDFKVFGLLDGRRDKFKITPLGLKVYRTHDIKLLEEARRHVGFWNYLSSKYNNVTKDNFLNELIVTAKIDKETAKKKIDLFFDAFADDFKFAASGPITDLPIINIITPPTAQKSSEEEVEPVQNIIETPLPKSVVENSTNETKGILKLHRPRGIIQYDGIEITINNETACSQADNLLKKIIKDLERELNAKFEI